MFLIQIEKKIFTKLVKFLINLDFEAIQPKHHVNLMKQKMQKSHCGKRKMKLLKLFQI